MSSDIYSFEYEAMTTPFEIIVAGQEQEYARQASTAAFDEIDRIESILSKYNDGSDIGQINLMEPGESARVGIETLECLDIAAWAYEVSDGLFDPTVGTGVNFLEINREAFTVGWKKEGKGELDLGGIGKGYAIDKAAEILRDWDIEEAVISGGTSTVLAIGREWELGVGGPWGEKTGLTSIKLKDKALSGSGTEVKGNHIKNPKTGGSAKRHLAAWAIHKSAAKSDALSTAFMMMPKENIKKLCQENPGITGFIVDQKESLIKIGV